MLISNDYTFREHMWVKNMVLLSPHRFLED